MQLDEIKKAQVAVVHLSNQPEGVIHQVTLRPDKIHDGLIRLGETQGDEILGWQFPENVEIVAILGDAVEENGQWKCVPENQVSE